MIGARQGGKGIHMDNKRQRAVFLDLDGTIANHNRPPSETVTAAIRRARAAGHRVFLCTGRAPAYIYDAVREVGFDGIVAAAGGYIRLGGEVLYRRFLSGELLRTVIGAYLENGKAVLLEGEVNMYAVNTPPYHKKEWPSVTGPEDFAAGGRFAGQGVYKFTAYGALGEERRVLEPAMNLICHDTYVEALPAGVNKADGMRRVLERIGVPQADSIAVGDSRNDIDMLLYAGTGVAMGGSPAEVVQAADRVTGTLEENGAAAVLEELLA